MKKIFLLTTLFLFYSFSYSQNYNKKFLELARAGNDSLTFQHLLTWEKATSSDPEMYIAFYNFYLLQGKKEVLRIDKTPSGEGSFKISDSTGNAVGFLNGSEIYDSANFSMAIKYINKGLELFPNRLDMHFGKCYVLNQMYMFSDLKDQIIKYINISVTNNNKWLWTYDMPYKDGKNSIIEATQNYVNYMFSGDSSDVAINYIMQISDSMIKYYPDKLYFYDNLGGCYIAKGDYDKALINLKKAEKIDTKDTYVMIKMAMAYEKKNDFSNAIKYYKKLGKYGDDKVISYTQEKIANLKEK